MLDSGIICADFFNVAQTGCALKNPAYSGFTEENPMNKWLVLGAAIVAETIATLAMKASDGFTKVIPSVIVVLGYGIAFYLLSITLRTIPVGIAYAIWSGVGIVLITIVGWSVFGQKLDAAALIGMGLIIAGVVVMNVFSTVQH